MFSETRCLSQDVFLEGGHRLITSLSAQSASGVGILIHHRFTKHIHTINCFSDWLMAVDFRFRGKTLRLFAVYFPHAGYPWSLFEKSWEDLSSLCMEAQDKGMQVIVGGDFNLELQRGDRGRCMHDFCDQFLLEVANSEGKSFDGNQWTFRSSLGYLRRIDFILFGKGLLLNDARANWSCTFVDVVSWGFGKK